MDSLVTRVAEGAVASVTGTWHRHVAMRYADTALDGWPGQGRWSTGGPVLYLGQPVDSVVVEAYRHLVDPVDDPALRLQIAPRLLVTCHVDVTGVLDLRVAQTRMRVGLSLARLRSATHDTDAYTACQRVAAAAREVGRTGILTPAATGLGDTLALFTDVLPAADRPGRVGPDQVCTQLPPDPRLRHLHAVRS